MPLARRSRVRKVGCHPFFAEETTEHLGAERIDLTALRTDVDTTPEARFE